MLTAVTFPVLKLCASPVLENQIFKLKKHRRAAIYVWNKDVPSYIFTISIRKLQNLAAGFTAFSPFQTEFCHQSSVLGCVFILPLLFYDLSVSNRGVAWTSRFPSPCAIIKICQQYWNVSWTSLWFNLGALGNTFLHQAGAEYQRTSIISIHFGLRSKFDNVCTNLASLFPLNTPCNTRQSFL